MPILDTDDLISPTEIVQMARVSKGAFANWTKRYKDFPPPVEIGRHVFYKKPEIVGWLKRTGRI